MKDFIFNMNSKKFVFAVVLVTLSFVLTLVDKITGVQFMTFSTAVGGVYVIVNTAEANNTK